MSPIISDVYKDVKEVKVTVIQVSREFMEDQPISVLSDSLMAIGIQLRNAIDAEKVIQAAKECGKIVVKRAIENYIQDTCGLYQK